MYLFKALKMPAVELKTSPNRRRSPLRQRSSKILRFSVSQCLSVLKGILVNRMCIVLIAGEDEVHVARFDSSETLPSRLTKELWYPFLPAGKDSNPNPCIWLGRSSG
jgi:hypothetical protein